MPETKTINLSLRDRRFITGTQFAFAISLVVIIALEITSFLILRKQIDREVDSGILVSASGEQRMRSQRIALLSLALLDVKSPELLSKTKGALLHEVQEMDATHNALIAGNPERRIAGEKSDAVRTIFFGQGLLDEKVRTFLSLAREYANLDPREYGAGNSILIRLTEMSTSLLALFEQLTNTYRDEGMTGIRGLEKLAAQILAVMVIGSLSIGAFIFIPVVRRLRSELAARNRARMDLLEQNSELEQFATIVAHDLKAPLNNIGGFSQYLKSRLSDQADKEANELLELIEQGVQRMGRMINELLQYARITRKEKKLEVIQLNQLLAKIIKDFEAEAIRTQARFEIKPLPSILGDAVQIEHLFHNLIGNALKYRRPDTAPFILVTRTKFHQTDTEEFVGETILVEDNGRGFPPGMESQMFQPFKRLAPSDDGDGIGFGLSLCKKIVKRHGGEIWAEAAPSGGARFYVTLPKA